MPHGHHEAYMSIEYGTADMKQNAMSMHSFICSTISLIERDSRIKTKVPCTTHTQTVFVVEISDYWGALSAKRCLLRKATSS